MLQQLPNWFRKPYFWLGLIMLFGFWLRIDQLNRKLWLYEALDEARDVIVAKHIIEYGELIQRGPFVAGGYFWLQNSPVYYYFLAGLWWLTRTPEKLILVWALIATSGIFLSYQAGKLIRDPTTGLLAALLYAIHPELVLIGSQILQPHLLPLFSLSAFICLIKAWKSKSGWWLIGAIWAILLPLHFHYAIVIFFPIFGIAFSLLCWQMITKRWHNWLEIFLYINSSGLILTVSWLLLTFRYKPFDQFLFFTLNGSAQNDQLVVRLIEVIARFSQLLVGSVSFWIWIIIGAISCWLGFFTFKQLNKTAKTSWIWLILISGLTGCFSLFFRGYIATTYLLSLVPFFLLLIAINFRSALKQNLLFGSGLIVLFCYWSIYQINLNLIQNIPAIGYTENFKAGSEAIYDDAKILTGDQPDFVIVALSSFMKVSFDVWKTGSYWYYLENLYQQRLVKLKDTDVNFWPMITNPKYIYLVCDHRWHPELETENCLQPFRFNRPHVDSGQQIFQDNLLTIWRFKVNLGQENLPWWHVEIN